MRQEAAIDGFRLAYERTGAGPAVLLLHGWPGDRTDYRAVAPLVSPAAGVIVPDLRGFGESDKHPADPARQYSAAAQARSIAGLIGELALGPAVIVGYDIGSRIAQAIARDRPELVRALVIAPPLPGHRGPDPRPAGPAGVLVPGLSQPRTVDRADRRPAGRRPRVPEALLVALVRARLRAGRRAPGPPGVGLRGAGRVRRLDRLVPGGRRVGRHLADRTGARPGRPDRGAHHGAVAGARSAVPRAWSDRIGEFFADARLTWLDGAGHFSPLEAPVAFAAAVAAAARNSPG